MSSEQVIRETRGPVSWVILDDRPDKLNALSTEPGRKALDSYATPWRTRRPGSWF